MVHFQIKGTACLARLKNMLSRRCEMKPETFRLLVGDTTIRDSDTPKSLGIADGGIVLITHRRHRRTRKGESHSAARLGVQKRGVQRRKPACKACGRRWPEKSFMIRD